MPYFREEDNKRKQNSWSEEAHSVLVLAIQTIDILPPVPGPHRDVTGYTYQEQLEELRQRLDLILNSEHWKEKRSKEDNERLNWYATTGGHSED
jgi:hypothetical protein